MLYCTQRVNHFTQYAIKPPSRPSNDNNCPVITSLHSPNVICHASLTALNTARFGGFITRHCSNNHIFHVEAVCITHKVFSILPGHFFFEDLLCDAVGTHYQSVNSAYPTQRASPPLPPPQAVRLYLHGWGSSVWLSHRARDGVPWIECPGMDPTKLVDRNPVAPVGLHGYHASMPRSPVLLAFAGLTFVGTHLPLKTPSHSHINKSCLFNQVNCVFCVKIFVATVQHCLDSACTQRCFQHL